MTIDYSKIELVLDTHFGVRFVSNVDYDNGLKSWSYSSNIGKSRYSNNFPKEFIEELSIGEMGLLFYLIYNVLPLNMYGHEGYLFDMTQDTFTDGSGNGIGKRTYLSFRNKLLHYDVCFKVNKFREESGASARNKYFFNPRYVSRSKPVVLKGKEKPSHILMSNYLKENIKNKDITEQTFNE